MSSPDRTVLERNLALLIGRGYTPVVPEASFREELHGLLLDAVRERLEVSEEGREAIVETTGRPGQLSRLRLVAGVIVPLAAAAAILALFLETGEPTPAESRADILAGGSVAWRELTSDPWRRWSDEERPEAGMDRVELVTPLETGVELELRAEGRAVLEPESHAVARWNDSSTALSIELEAGGATLDRVPAATPGPERPPWSLRTADGSAAHDFGSLAMKRSRSPDETRLLLLEGAARVLDGNTWVALRPGEPEILSGGRLRRGAVSPLEPISAPDRKQVASTELGAGAQAEEPLDEEPAPADSRASISLTVVTEPGAKPAREFRVSLLERRPIPDVRTPRVWSVTDSETGRLEISGLEPGSYALDVVAEGFAPWRAPEITVLDGVTSWQLAALESGRRIRGLVLGPDGLPLEGATVLSETEAPPQPISMDIEALEGQIASMATTDAQGRFELLQLRRGEHVLRASHPEYASGWSQRLVLEPGRDPEEPTLRLTRGGTIRGRVETEEGLPWAGVDVLASLSDMGGERLLMNYRAMTADQFGRFEIDRLPAGQYAVVRLGTELDEESAMQPDFRLVELRDGQVLEVDFLLGSSGVRLHGRLITRSGLPVPSMGLSIMRLDESPWQEADQQFALSDGRGNYELPDLEPGRYAIYITPDTGGTVVKVDEIDVPRLPEFERDVELSGVGVEGILRDGETGEPLRNCFVSLTEIEVPSEPGVFVGRQITRDDGRFYFPHVREYYYRITAQSTVENYGHESIEEILPRPDGEPVVIELRPGGFISSRVVDAAGAPIRGASLHFRDQDGLQVEFGVSDVTGSAGTHLARGARPGTWTVTARAAGRDPVTVVCRVAAGLTEELEFVLERRDESAREKR